MAKRVHSVSLKGLLHVEEDGSMSVEEVNVKAETSEFFDLKAILEEFGDKMISITIKEEQLVAES